MTTMVEDFSRLSNWLAEFICTVVAIVTRESAVKEYDNGGRVSRGSLFGWGRGDQPR